MGMIRDSEGAELSCGLSVGKGLVADGRWKIQIKKQTDNTTHTLRGVIQTTVIDEILMVHEFILYNI